MPITEMTFRELWDEAGINQAVHADDVLKFSTDLAPLESWVGLLIIPENDRAQAVVSILTSHCLHEIKYSGQDRRWDATPLQDFAWVEYSESIDATSGEKWASARSVNNGGGLEFTTRGVGVLAERVKQFSSLFLESLKASDPQRWGG